MFNVIWIPNSSYLCIYVSVDTSAHIKILTFQLHCVSVHLWFLRLLFRGDLHTVTESHRFPPSAVDHWGLLSLRPTRITHRMGTGGTETSNSWRPKRSSVVKSLLLYILLRLWNRPKYKKRVMIIKNEDKWLFFCTLLLYTEKDPNNNKETFSFCKTLSDTFDITGKVYKRLHKVEIRIWGLYRQNETLRTFLRSERRIMSQVHLFFQSNYY